ncbi:uncharacterized protein BDR25DRAFT_286240 [Lindgomyces ingoldianus]|uniref:Uncharacterized protein n=1 Tax=Lindgomyces ingoldianus TaxID=673940 RepID=A0ACB6QVN7_9PLEO|nr:uncharacterized protein BDR25DRAFT_286240 [Lindgomyces ingoldianus]KAF2470936.1 hypothetical protein BDR25DRAFT_286240 [Lindgomyces ingoldianus]
MAASFSFGFSGDDIEEDPNDISAPGGNSENQKAEEGGPPPLIAQTHDLDELLSSIPDKISYSTLSITSPKGFTTRLPRRELFDVRLQLMAEDGNSTSNPLSGLDASDVKTNVYEGGYKTWECSIDLVKFLLDRGPRKDLDDLVRVNHVIEMGCGTALPTLLLFQYALKNGLVGLYVTLTDYNADVLRLVTVPNLLLAYASTIAAREAPFSNDSPNPLADENADSGDLYITPTFLQAFRSTLSSLGLTLTLLSGSWRPVSSLLPLIPSAPELNTFVLASETIYSPTSLLAFTEAMAALLKRVKSGKAIVAAKRVYFGVGGSVDGFRQECANRGLVAYEMEFEGLEEGVRRCLVEVQMY